MSERPIIHTTLEDFKGISQTLKLACQKCGDQFVYNVGVICCDPPQKGESGETNYTFAAYFRCRKCDSAGPWDVVDRWKMLALVARAMAGVKSEGFKIVRCMMFDGSVFQTPAMGEDYLRRLIQKEPGNAFLHTRLGNVFKNCGHDAKASEWYEQALRLDSNDIEARYSLFNFATQSDKVEDQKVHAMALTRSFLDGHTTHKDELTQGLARSLVENLRAAPPAFLEQLLEEQPARANSREEIFMRTLLSEEGDEDAIVRDAVERLLSGGTLPLRKGDASDSSDESDALSFHPVPSLQAVVVAHRLNPRNLCVAFEANGQGNFSIRQKQSIPIYDGVKIVPWEVPALAGLFRGHGVPPDDIDRYPPEYGPHFFLIENHFLTLCDKTKDRSDQEMEEIYAALRRRPDGRSLGAVHDFMWQVTALLLGSRVVSAAEYDALLGALVRSTRKWSLRPISRNYVAYLRKTFPDPIGQSG